MSRWRSFRIESNQQQKLLHLHDRVPNVGELVSIEKTRVLFQDGGQEEWLELAMLTDLDQARRIPPLPESLQGRLPALSQPPRSIQLASLTRMVSPTAAVSSLGSNRPIQVIDRRELAKALSDIPLLLLQAQPVVSMVEGRFNGMLLEAVRADGLYAQMGLQSATIEAHQWNGTPRSKHGHCRPSAVEGRTEGEAGYCA